MNASDRADSIEPRLPLLVFVCVCVLVFRVLAWLEPSGFIVVPPSLSLATGVLGVLYLFCGVWIWLRRPSSLTRIFLLTAIGGAIHWGGTIATDSTALEIALLFFYLSATAMGDGAFLDFALRYPHDIQRGNLVAISFYLPALITLILVPIAPFFPTSLVETGVGGIITVAFMMSVAGGVVFVMKWMSASPAERGESYLTLIVVAIVVSTVIDLLADAGVLPGDSEAWTLTYAIVPVSLAWALLQRRSDEET